MVKKNWRESVRSWKVGGDFSTYPRSNILQRKTLTAQNFREPFYTLPPLKKLTVKILHCVSRILELYLWIPRRTNWAMWGLSYIWFTLYCRQQNNFQYGIKMETPQDFILSSCFIISSSWIIFISMSLATKKHANDN